jgi:hypothetical protein
LQRHFFQLNREFRSKKELTGLSVGVLGRVELAVTIGILHGKFVLSI